MKLAGLIFDIRRFSTHDGAGIRTTVFFKGCPLRCVWCQNPEGISPKRQLAYFPTTCILCGSCTKIKDGAAYLEKGRLVIKPDKAVKIETYENICPSGALRVDSRWYIVDELADVLERDRPFFKYGGGVTLSGGEPFFQAEFAIKLLKKLKNINISTAVESSLFVESKFLNKALPFIDTLFADFKIYDKAKHQEFTGVSNNIIKKNLKMILQSPYRNNVIVRTPLIPRYTSTKENLGAIAKAISEWYPQVRYELLNYNPLAQAKYEHVEYDYCFVKNPPPYTEKEIVAFYDIVKAAGVINC